MQLLCRVSFFYFPLALCPATNFTGQVSCDTNTLTLTWDQSPLSGVTYTLKTERIGDTLPPSELTTSNTSHVLTSLQCGQRYAFHIAAQDGNCRSSYSPPVEISTGGMCLYDNSFKQSKFDILVIILSISISSNFTLILFYILKANIVLLSPLCLSDSLGTSYFLNYDFSYRFTSINFADNSDLNTGLLLFSFSFFKVKNLLTLAIVVELGAAK